MTPPSRSLLLAILLAVLALPRPARAHQTSVLYLDFTVRGRAVDLEARIAADDLGDPIGRTPLLPPTRAQALAGAERATRYVTDGVRVFNGGAACEPTAGPFALRERPRDNSYALAVTARYVCARQVDDLRLRDELFFDLDPRHQALVQVTAFGATRELTFRADQREARISGPASLLAQFGDYLLLGVEHIFTGYDHIAFLLGLLLVAAQKGLRRGARSALGVVTAFTVAHSVTLLSAALGWITLPSRLVESAIAASILYVALDNLRAREPRHRWQLTFAFGLVHGLGFAGALAELGLPARGLALSLLAFNVGVELGQLAVVALAFPALVAVTRLRPRRALAVRRAASVILALFAALWLAERVLGRALLHGALG